MNHSFGISCGVVVVNDIFQVDQFSLISSFWSWQDCLSSSITDFHLSSNLYLKTLVSCLGSCLLMVQCFVNLWSCLFDVGSANSVLIHKKCGTLLHWGYYLLLILLLFLCTGCSDYFYTCYLQLKILQWAKKLKSVNQSCQITDPVLISWVFSVIYIEDEGWGLLGVLVYPRN